MNKISTKYRVIYDNDGVPLDGFLDDNGEPVEFGAASVTYFPDGRECDTGDDEISIKAKMKTRKENAEMGVKEEL